MEQAYVSTIPEIDPERIAAAVADIYTGITRSATPVVLGHVAGRFSFLEADAIRSQAIHDLPMVADVQTAGNEQHLTYLVYRSIASLLPS